MLKDETKIVKVGTQGGARIYLPSNVFNDSQLTFRDGEKVTVRIDPDTNTVIISGANSLVKDE